MKIILHIVLILALAAPGLALVGRGYVSSQLTAADQLQSATEVVGADNTELSAAPNDAVIDDWGMPHFIPGHAG
jgi:hypothetical protein